MSQPSGQPLSSIDYSDVDSLEKAERWVEFGELVVLLLLPEEAGGERQSGNIVYVPPFVADLKAEADQEAFRPVREQGKFVEYSVIPAYAGNCLVPTGLTITATSPERFARHIMIWNPVKVWKPEA